MKRFAVLSLLACAASAQQTAALPEFEVASVKVAEPLNPTMAGGGAVVFRRASGCRKPDPGMVNCSGATMKQLLVQAYEVKPYQVQGPAWIDTDRYDLMGKIPEGVGQDQVPKMLQALLADRFKVTLHKETKPLPVYELSVGKGGPKLKEVDQKEVDAFKAVQAERAARGPDALPPPPPPGGRGGPGGRGPVAVAEMPVGSMMMSMSSNGARTIRGKMDITQLVNMLTNQLGRPMFDATNLKGTYEIELSYLGDGTDAMSSQMQSMAIMAGAGPSGGGGDAGGGGRGADASTPTATLAQAFQGLGLKLEAKKAPIDLIVIDSGNKVPTEN